MIGTVDGVRALHECHPGAVYLHAGRQYLVKELEREERRVRAVAADLDYFTTPLTEKQTEILEVLQQSDDGALACGLGRLKVTEWVVGFERKRVHGQETIDQTPLDLPPVEFETVGLWWQAPRHFEETLRRAGEHFLGALHAAEHASISLFPLLALCDRGDIGGISYPLHPQVGCGAVFIYDGHPGGIGIAARGFEDLSGLLDRVLQLIDGCPCEAGCPSCIQSPKCGNGNRPLHKSGAARILRLLLGREAAAVPPIPPLPAAAFAPPTSIPATPPTALAPSISISAAPPVDALALAACISAAPSEVVFGPATSLPATPSGAFAAPTYTPAAPTATDFASQASIPAGPPVAVDGRASTPVALPSASSALATFYPATPASGADPGADGFGAFWSPDASAAGDASIAPLTSPAGAGLQAGLASGDPGTVLAPEGCTLDDAWADWALPPAGVAPFGRLAASDGAGAGAGPLGAGPLGAGPLGAGPLGAGPLGAGPLEAGAALAVRVGEEETWRRRARMPRMEAGEEAAAPARGLSREQARRHKERPNTLLFDVETLRSAAEVGGFGNCHRMGVAVAVACFLEEGRFVSFDERRVHELAAALHRATLVIGYNIKRFDYGVLAGYTGEDYCRTLPTLDLLEEVHHRLGFRLGMGRLAMATLGSTKSADGLQSLEWVRQGRIDLVEEYCRHDVEILRDLYLHGRREGCVVYHDPRRDVRLRVAVDW